MNLVLFYPDFMDEKAEAQRGYVTCPRSHSVQTGLLSSKGRGIMLLPVEMWRESEMGGWEGDEGRALG